MQIIHVYQVSKWVSLKIYVAVFFLHEIHLLASSDASLQRSLGILVIFLRDWEWQIPFGGIILEAANMLTADVEFYRLDVEG